MGVIQHHDAISGTERQHVADDYIQRLSQGIDAAMVSHKSRSMISNMERLIFSLCDDVYLVRKGLNETDQKNRID